MLILQRNLRYSFLGGEYVAERTEQSKKIDKIKFEVAQEMGIVDKDGQKNKKKIKKS
jgi:hypothetical protein